VETSTALAAQMSKGTAAIVASGVMKTVCDVASQFFQDGANLAGHSWNRRLRHTV
jgi:hypothetical protein